MPSFLKVGLFCKAMKKATSETKQRGRRQERQGEGRRVRKEGFKKKNTENLRFFTGIFRYYLCFITVYFEKEREKKAIISAITDAVTISPQAFVSGQRNSLQLWVRRSGNP